MICGELEIIQISLKYMKIFVNSRLIEEKQTGVQNYIINLYRNLLLDKKNNYFFIQSSNLKTIGNTQLIPKILPGFWGNMLFDCFMINRILKKYKNEQIIYHGTSFILPFFKLRNVKYVLTVHDLGFLIFPKFYSLPFRIYYALFFKRSLNNADIIIANSENTKNDLIKFYNIPSDKVRVTYLSHDDDFKGRIINENRDGGYILTVVGQLRKNTEAVIRAYKQSYFLGGYNLLLLGRVEDAYKKKLLMLIRELGIIDKVTFLGYVAREDLINLYSNAKVFVYMSNYEGFGIPILEAMSLKCPIVVSENKCFKEIIPYDFDYFANPLSIDDIRDKIERNVRLSEEDRRKEVENNYRFASNFSWMNCAQDTLRVFSELI